MGLLEKILRKPRTDNGVTNAGGFQTFTSYNPVFTSYSGHIHEQELTRSAIEAFATACSKLKPEINGNTKPHIRRAIRTSPNFMQTWPQFLNRAAAIFDAEGTVAIVPSFDRDMEKVLGFWALKYDTAEVVDLNGTPWVKFNFIAREPAALKLEEVCFINKFQIDSDIFAEHNCLGETMNLIHAQNQAQNEAIRNGAKIRFIGRISGQVREEDMEKKRKRFVESNLSADNNGGIMVYDQTWDDVRELTPTDYTISSEEMARIEGNVFNYFHCNKAVLQNDFTEEQWTSWYEGKIEPFAIALGEGLTKLCFTDSERYSNGSGYKNYISFSSNRLQYASTKTKVNAIEKFVDRGIISLNEAREMLQLPPVDGGDIRVIRGEYINADDVESENVDVADDDIEGNDDNADS